MNPRQRARERIVNTLLLNTELYELRAAYRSIELAKCMAALQALARGEYDDIVDIPEAAAPELVSIVADRYNLDIVLELHETDIQSLEHYHV